MILDADTYWLLVGGHDNNGAVASSPNGSQAASGDGTAWKRVNSGSSGVSWEQVIGDGAFELVGEKVPEPHAGSTLFFFAAAAVPLLALRGKSTA